MTYSLRVLGDIFTDKKYDLVKKNRYTAHTEKQIIEVLQGNILDPKNSENKPKDNTAINISTKKLLELQGIDIKDLEGKKILDIGGGFTGLPFLLKGLKAEINIVDPVFLNDLKIEIERNKKKILYLIPEFDEKNYKYYKEGNIEKQEYLYNLNYEFNNILYDLVKWEKEYKYNDFLIGDTRIKIFPNTGEEINFIDNQSIDLIFINHTITKNQVNPYLLLNKAYDLLKVGGKLYITESDKLDFSSFKMCNEEFNIEVINSYYLNDKTILILEKI